MSLIELLKLAVSHWPHERDRAVYVHRDKVTGEVIREEVLYDSGCKHCRRCFMEKWIAMFEELN